MGYREFDVVVFSLSRSRLRSKQPATVDFFEVTVGELVPALGFFVVFIVYSEMSSGVFGVAMLPNELVLLLCGGLVFAPRVAVVNDVLARPDQALCVIERPLVQLDCHRLPSMGRSTLIGSNVPVPVQRTPSLVPRLNSLRPMQLPGFVLTTPDIAGRWSWPDGSRLCCDRRPSGRATREARLGPKYR